MRDVVQTILNLNFTHNNAKLHQKWKCVTSIVHDTGGRDKLTDFMKNLTSYIYSMYNVFLFWHVLTPFNAVKDNLKLLN
jgi:hypothetical protein